MLTPFTFPNEPVEPTRRENNPLFHSTSLDNVGHRPRNQAVVISPGVFPLLTYTKKDILENIHQNQRNWVDELAGAGGNIAAILPFAAGASYFAANPAFADDVRAFLKDLDIGPVRPPPRDDTPTDVGDEMTQDQATSLPPAKAPTYAGAARTPVVPDDFNYESEVDILLPVPQRIVKGQDRYALTKPWVVFVYGQSNDLHAYASAQQTFAVSADFAFNYIPLDRPDRPSWVLCTLSGPPAIVSDDQAKIGRALLAIRKHFVSRTPFQKLVNRIFAKRQVLAGSDAAKAWEATATWALQFHGVRDKSGREKFVYTLMGEPITEDSADHNAFLAEIRNVAQIWVGPCVLERDVQHIRCALCKMDAHAGFECPFPSRDGWLGPDDKVVKRLEDRAKKVADDRDPGRNERRDGQRGGGGSRRHSDRRGATNDDRNDDRDRGERGGGGGPARTNGWHKVGRGGSRGRGRY